METSSLIILLGGISGILSLLFGDYIIYHKHMRVKVDLLTKITNAENELKKDIEEIGTKELGMTRAGIELLKSFSEEKIEENKLKSNIFTFKFPKNLNTSIGYGYALTAITLVLALTLGINVLTAKNSIFSPQVTVVQVEQVRLQATNQQKIYEIQLKLQEAETEKQISVLQAQQKSLQFQQIKVHWQIENQLEIQKRAINSQIILSSATALCIVLLIINVGYTTFNKTRTRKTK